MIREPRYMKFSCGHIGEYLFEVLMNNLSVVWIFLSASSSCIVPWLTLYYSAISESFQRAHVNYKTYLYFLLQLFGGNQELFLVYERKYANSLSHGQNAHNYKSNCLNTLFSYNLDVLTIK